MKNIQMNQINKAKIFSAIHEIERSKIAEAGNDCNLEAIRDYWGSYRAYSNICKEQIHQQF